MKTKNPATTNPSPEVLKANEAKRQARTMANYITTARGTRHITTEDNTTTFGFTDLQYWDKRTQSWLPLSNDPDKFLITADDFSTACAEFWARWRIYCERRFNLNYVKIETN